MRGYLKRRYYLYKIKHGSHIIGNWYTPAVREFYTVHVNILTQKIKLTLTKYKFILYTTHRWHTMWVSIGQPTHVRDSERWSEDWKKRENGDETGKKEWRTETKKPYVGRSDGGERDGRGKKENKKDTFTIYICVSCKTSRQLKKIN